MSEIFLKLIHTGSGSCERLYLG